MSGPAVPPLEIPAARAPARRVPRQWFLPRLTVRGLMVAVAVLAVGAWLGSRVVPPWLRRIAACRHALARVDWAGRNLGPRFASTFNTRDFRLVSAVERPAGFWASMPAAHWEFRFERVAGSGRREHLLRSRKASLAKSRPWWCPPDPEVRR